MARKPSVVLTPAEKKAVIKDLKEQVKNAALAAKALVAEAKAIAKARTAEDKDFAKREAAAAKELAKLNAQLEAATAA